MGSRGADVRVVGVGGAGGNALRQLAPRAAQGVTLIAANTDAQALADHPAHLSLALGPRSRRGLGAGGKASAGLAAAQESAQQIARAIDGADLVFVAAGLGGGTGTGAAALVASIARDAGALVVAVVTLPFAFEGARRARVAREGLDALSEHVDSLLVIPNDRLLEMGGEEPTAIEAFSRADAILCEGVRGIGDLIVRPGLINLDFADVRAVLANGGRTVMGIGAASGPDRALRAVAEASRSPLLESGTIEGARGVLLSFTVDPRMSLGGIHEAAARIHAQVDDDAEIVFGVTVDETLEDEARVTLVAAGIEACQPAPEVSREIAIVQRELPVAAIAPRRRNALVMLKA
jgi:cell division protein FtsZ